MRVTMVGHATILIELDGVRILTDPLLRDRTTVLRALPRPSDPRWSEGLDAVLLSHFHRDHYDVRSLVHLGRGVRIAGPPGARRRLERHGFAAVSELRPGESLSVAGVEISATPARHGRLPRALATPALGFVVEGSRSVYFAGDTDLFEEMASLAALELDLALLPVGGWGPRLGAGHLDPLRAAQALQLVRPRLAVPIHWGLLYPLGLGWLHPRYLSDPGDAFRLAAAKVAPQVDVVVLAPGETLEVGNGGGAPR
jgi:L-ascorbate metabolism protein UlaG (beta-lactamase superfamily)